VVRIEITYSFHPRFNRPLSIPADGRKMKVSGGAFGGVGLMLKSLGELVVN